MISLPIFKVPYLSTVFTYRYVSTHFGNLKNSTFIFVRVAIMKIIKWAMEKQVNPPSKVYIVSPVEGF